jgi:hypothetical protein
LKNDLKSPHSVGPKTGPWLQCLAQRPAMHGWSEGRLGHNLAAWSSRGGGPRRAETGRALLVRAGAVTRSTATRWGLAGSKVLPTSTGGVAGWRLVDRVEAGLTLAAPRCEGWSSGIGAEAVADVEEARFPVSGRAGLRQERRRGR